MSRKRGQTARTQKKQKATKKESEEIPASQKVNENSLPKFSLYSLLQLQKGAKSTPEEIKAQYRKLVIIYHPDKNIGDESAKEKFTKLKQAYDILSDPEKKKVYDETGSLGDSFDENSFQTAYEYFRGLFKKVEKEDIVNFEKEYRHGLMEEQDLIQFYTSHQGNMVTLLQCIPLSKNEDIPRFIEFFENGIKDGRLKEYKSFEKTKNRVRELKDESKQFEQQEKEKKSQMEALTLAIRNKSNKSFLDSLEQKYCSKKERKKVEQKPEWKAIEKKRKPKNL